jgi:hypothetical protein
MYTIWFRLEGDNPADMLRVDVDQGLTAARMIWQRLSVCFTMISARP